MNTTWYQPLLLMPPKIIEIKTTFTVLVFSLFTLSGLTTSTRASTSPFEYKPAHYLCSQELIDAVNGAYQHGGMPGARLTSGPEISYHEQSLFPEETKRLEDVFLEIQQDIKSEDLFSLAHLLAQGGPVEPVLQLLQITLEQQKSGVQSPTPLKLFLPPIAQQRTNTFFEWGDNLALIDSGPNCCHASLAWHKPDTALERLPPNQMQTILRSTFKLIPLNSKLLLGDVIAIWQDFPKGGTALLHTAIYINSQIGWHKPSRFAFDPWTFESMANIMNFYLNEARARGYHLNIEYYRYEDQASDSLSRL